MGKRVLFLNGPSQDACDRFFGWPTSLLYAIAPTIDAVQRGLLDVEYTSPMFDPVSCIEGVNDKEVYCAFDEVIGDVDIVCASATYDSLYPTLRLLARAKKLRPNVVTILGGPHFDEVHDRSHTSDVWKNCSAVDYGIAGDGEYALLALMQALSTYRLGDLSLDRVAGKAWVYTRRGRAMTSGKPLDLDALPFMQLDLADTRRHRNNFDVFATDGAILPTVQMIAKRGCDYECEFCSESRHLTYPNARSIQSILEEVELRKSQGYQAVFFDDSTFGLYPRLNILLRELAATGMAFGCLNRFNHLKNERQLQAYREAGFVYFYCSIEQFDDKPLKLMNKAQDTRAIRESMSLLSEYGFMLGVSLLYGLAGEDESTIRSTLDFVQHWVAEGTVRLVSESVLSFHPGTPEGKSKAGSFSRTPPNRGFPFDRFEEGQWWHPRHVTASYLERILEESEDRFGAAMVRNRHSWYAKNGYILGGQTEAKVHAG